jgi:hypothetical protein
MNKALAGVLAVALAGLVAGSAMAQVPNIQVYFDAYWTQTQADCPSVPTGPFELYVVMNNWNMNVTAVDFSIAYPQAVAFIGDILPDDPPGSTMTKIGDSATGVVVGWGGCCTPDGFLPVLALKPFVQWGPCDCNNHIHGDPGEMPQAIVVGGYTPLGKPTPTAVRLEDFQEYPGVGMTSLICPGFIAVQSSTWGQVKALYR